MSQRLILPINQCKVNAGYKSEKYRKDWGFAHYGVDLGSTNGSRTVYACGDGEVAACGQDGESLTGPSSRLGNCAVIVYRDVLLPSGKAVDLACRMFHFDKLSVQPGQRVTKDTAIGQFGATGYHVSGPHLHIEFDVDTKWPTLAYGVSQGGQVINRVETVRAAGGLVDSTLNPSQVWYLDQNQSISTDPSWVKEGWVFAEDTEIPSLPQDETEINYKALYDAAKEEIIQQVARAERAEQKLKQIAAVIAD